MRRVISPTRVISIAVLLCFVSIFCATQACAAQGDVIWQKTYGETADQLSNSACQTTDGGYILAGSTDAFGNNSQIMSLKTDADGTFQWQNVYNGTGSDSDKSVQQTTDGGYILVGSTTTPCNSSQVYLVKTGPDGTPQWQKNYGERGDEFGESVQQTTDGGYIISGDIQSGNTTKAILVKTDMNGTQQWLNTYETAGNSTTAKSVRQTSDGGYIFVGRDLNPNATNTQVPGGVSGVYIVKTDSNGNTQWTQDYDLFAQFDSGSSVVQTDDGGYMVVGTADDVDKIHILAIKVDANGNLLNSGRYWQIDSPAGTFIGKSITPTSDGGFILACSAWVYSDFVGTFPYIVKIDSKCTKLWDQVINTNTGTGTNTPVNDIQTTTDGNYILPGATNMNITDNTTTQTNNTEAYLLKISSGATPQNAHLEVVPNTSSVPVGGGQSYDLILSTAPTGLAGYDLTISTNSSVANITSVSWPSWAQQLHNNTTLTPDAMRINGVDLNNQIKDGATNVTLATITVQGNTQGNTTIGLSNVSMDDDHGDQITPMIVNGSLNVNQLKPFPGQTKTPTDPDHDGLYDDINGNGRFDFSDIVVFFQNLDWVRDNQPISAFDFNGNGRLDFDDVVTLYDMLLKTV